MIGTKPDTSTLEPLATGVARTDATGRTLYANPAFIEYTGYGLSRLLGRSLDALHPGGERLLTAARRAHAEHGMRVLHDVPVCAAPGHEARLDFTFTPVGAEVWVETHPATLAAGSSRVSQSLRGFAHEVRNPLAAISGAAQLLQHGAGDARQRELAQLIHAEAARLAMLAERLLGTRSQAPARAVNLHALLERVAELLSAERADITVVRDYDPSLPAWHGDPDRLLQALLNLTRNAAEAGARQVVLRSRAEAGWRDARGQRVPALRVEVEDDGSGVPDAIAATLFEPLVSGRPDGTGLGLALAREIAREHGGELTLQRRTRGACFVLLLPRHAHAGDSS